tara:strand:+ start:1428 stop:3653 length:2226 start_codon:yes stop_codon:yes gene_type:complete
VPKAAIKIERFDKGFTDKVSKRDLLEGNLAEALNVNVAEVGQISNLGTFSAAGATLTEGSGGTTINDSDINIQSGFGLFTFKSDVAPISGKTAGEHIVFTDDDGSVFINDSASSSGSATMIAFQSADVSTGTGVKPVYYYADGGLRINQSVVDDTSTTTNARKTSLIRLSRTQSSATAYSADVTDSMQMFNSGLVAPTASDFEKQDPVTPDTTSPGADPDGDKFFRLGLKADGTDGLWQPGNYAIGLSYVYHNNQESKITNFTSMQAITEGQYPVVQMSIGESEIDVSGQNKFIQGVRVYLRNVEAGDEEYVLLLDVDLEQGSRISLLDDFDAFDATGTGFLVTNDAKNTAAVTAYEVKQPNIETYSTINGYAPSEHAIDFYNTAFGYKTATVANQRAFVGNVRYVDNVGKTKVMGDRIQYSPPLKYDTFPQTYFIDIGANDGDEIVKLVEFRDRLFVYKKNKLFVINISSTTDAGWYLEGEFVNRGVQSPGAVVKTDLGLMWVNQHGLFAFANGITKLTDAIKESTWARNNDDDADIDESKLLIGFIPKKNQVIIVKDSGDMSDGGYLYDLLTKSIVKIDENNVLKIGVDANDRPISNFIVLNNELCCISGDEASSGSTDSKLLKFDVNTPSAQVVDIQTREYTGGLNSVDKKFYSVYVTYKNNGSSLQLKARFDDESSFTDKFVSSNLLNSSSITTQEFILTDANQVFKKSLQLQIVGTTHADFQLEDITIIARTKGVR